MPENLRGILVYELICCIRARTALVNRAPGHTGFQWPISPNLFKITRVTIGGGQEVIYEVSFGAIVFDLE